MVPRKFDPRSGTIPFSYNDYSTPVNESTRKVFFAPSVRKKDPAAEESEAIDPIVYYLDNGTPEPVRSALLEGVHGGIRLLKQQNIKTLFKSRFYPMMLTLWMFATM